MIKRNNNKLLVFIFIPLVTLLLGWSIAYQQYQKRVYSLNESIKNIKEKQEQLKEKKDTSKNPINLDLYWETFSVLDNKYVKGNDFDRKEIVYGSIKGMVSSLGDPYTAFMTPKENKDFHDSLHGELQGIGAELTMKEGVITVVSPLKDSPASKAGLQPQDIIIEINHEDAIGLTLEESVLKIRGPKGSKVILKVIRKDVEEPLEIEIKRDIITLDSVSTEFKEDNKYAYISINQFGDTTVEEFDKALDEVLLKKPKGIILDLRFNGGGYLDGAVDIVSRFIEDNVVVIIRKRLEKDNEIHFTTGNARIKDIPVVLLINKGSASASEIVAGAMQDHKRGYIIGEQSFGKGTVQEVVNLSNGASLRVTIAEWYTPNNRSITEKGITPDLEIKRTIEDYEADKDPQLDAAIEYLDKKVK